MPKPAHERKRPRIGDVIEIETPRGLAYAQYTHEHRDPPRYGSLIRVLPGLFSARPAAFADLVRQEEQFSVFIPLGAALNRGIFRIVASEPVPERKSRFPTFGTRSYDGTFWWMWDGKREWKSRSGEARTPTAVEEVWNDTALIDRITAQWSPSRTTA